MLHLKGILYICLFGLLECLVMLLILKLLTVKLLKQGYRYHKLRKTFSKFYRCDYDLVSKFNTGLKYLLKQGLSEPKFYGDYVYKLFFFFFFCTN